MNYYAQGGQAQGLKSLAQELPKYGRYGDDVVAHISSDEARMLKAMGGSGTINPVTGLPEYFFKAISRAVAAPFKAVNEVVKAVPIIGPAIDRGLVGLDKAVGNTIPGGWNTLAQTALAFTPLGLPAKVGLAALGGSGAFGPNGKFNLQKAILSGAMAYGANQLTAGLSEAGGGAYDPSTGLTDATAKAASNIDPSVLEGMTAEQVANAASSTPYYQAAQSNIDPSLLEGMSKAQVAGANVLPSVPNAAAPTFLERMATGTAENLSSAGRGIVNLSGLGPQGAAGASTAATNFLKPVTTAGITSLAVGTLGTMQLDEQQKALDAQLATGSIAQSEYDAQSARIAEGRARAEQAVRDNPYQFASGGSVDDESGMDEARGMMQGNLQKGLFGMGYAKGGEAKERRDYLDRLEAELRMPSAQYVEGIGFMTPPPSVGGRLGANFDALGGNIRAGVSGNAMMGQDRKIIARPEMMDIGYKGQVGPGELDVGLQRAIQSMPGRNKDYAVNAKYSMKFADGGNVSTEPRFLSGGGDGMSDSIPATINGRQEARLADGEFVIPADVVSHLGNGSSKAGAKRLYSMMDKVRSARTGMKKQAPAINTKKLMPA